MSAKPHPISAPALPVLTRADWDPAERWFRDTPRRCPEPFCGGRLMVEPQTHEAEGRVWCAMGCGRAVALISLTSTLFTVQLGALPAPTPTVLAPAPPRPWSSEYGACQECGTTDRPHHARGLCQNCWIRNWRYQWTGRGRWAADHERCIRCGTTDYRYEGRGLCTYCYRQARAERDRQLAATAAPSGGEAGAG